MSVSIVKAPCRRLTHAERWNPRPLQKSTGVVSAKATHCQPGNCHGVTIETAMTGTAMAAETTSRRLIASVRALAAASASSLGSGGPAS